MQKCQSMTPTSRAMLAHESRSTHQLRWNKTRQTPPTCACIVNVISQQATKTEPILLRAFLVVNILNASRPIFKTPFSDYIKKMNCLCVFCRLSATCDALHSDCEYKDSSILIFDLKMRLLVWQLLGVCSSWGSLVDM